MKINPAKTQFLVTDHGTHSSIRTFHRRSDLMLFDGDGKAIRPITSENWAKLQKDWPKETAEQRLSVKRVWFLVEDKK